MEERDSTPSGGNQAAGQPRTDERATRRDFLKTTGAGIVGLSLTGANARHVGPGGPRARAFRSLWPSGIRRHWIGPEYWTNPLQDWQLADGRVELVAAGAERNVHLLTREIGTGDGKLEMRVLVGLNRAGMGAAGFYIGVRGPLNEYRHNAIHGTGLKAGITSEGRLFIGNGESVPLSRSAGYPVELRLAAVPGEAAYKVTLAAHDTHSGHRIGQVVERGVAPDVLEGNVGLHADYSDREGSALKRGDARLWFRDFRINGTKVQNRDERAFGPVLFAQYTLSRDVLKMTAQMPPLGEEDSRRVRLQLRRDGQWETAAEARIDRLARTARFRVEGWEASEDMPYRIAYSLVRSEGTQEHVYEGTVRRDPVDRTPLVVGVLSCATDPIFPNSKVAAGLRNHNPDVLAFTGDQLYESSGGYGVERRRDDVALSTLDYLRRWYMHGWAFGHFMRDRPTICIPDDHDVFQGNLWGAGGRAAETYEEHNDGGYFMPAEWVNMIQRTQTSHLPDAADPTPVDQGISVYYTDMVYGRVSFAILEDRKWKSGPDGLIPSYSGRVDHIRDSSIDPAGLDVSGAELLGRRQLAFLDEWASNWCGADLKVIVSQTAFASVANMHGHDFEVLVADLDSNGWPQTARNEALRRFRKGFALQIGGDQHLPMIVRYGVDDFDDAGYVFCTPAIAAGYPRAFEPGTNGRYRDGLGNRFTLHALANPRRPFRENLLERQDDKVSGYGIVRIDRSERTYTIEAWPILSDPRRDSDQFDGWPKTIYFEENYGRDAAAYLPELVFANVEHPIVQVVGPEEEIVYTLRIQGRRFRPKVFADGVYAIRIGDDSGWLKAIEGLRSGPADAKRELEVLV